MDETLVYLMRVYKWPFEYTRKLVRTLPLKSLNALVAETRRQEELTELKRLYPLAIIASAMTGEPIASFIEVPEERDHDPGTDRGTQAPDDHPEGSHFYTVPAQPERP